MPGVVDRVLIGYGETSLKQVSKQMDAVDHQWVRSESLLFEDCNRFSQHVVIQVHILNEGGLRLPFRVAEMLMRSLRAWDRACTEVRETSLFLIFAPTGHHSLTRHSAEDKKKKKKKMGFVPTFENITESQRKSFPG